MIVKEVFLSVQGEGANTGRPAVFVRFSGCNLSCEWCDTDHEHGEEMTAEQVLHKVEAVAEAVRFLVFTGGEPGLQIADDHGLELLGLLGARGFTMAVETNGTIPGLGRMGLIPWTTVSPKTDASWVLRAGSELKVVYYGQDLSMYEEALASRSFNYYYLQPLDTPGGDQDKAIRDTIEAATKDPRWRVSFQVHKMLGVR